MSNIDHIKKFIQSSKYVYKNIQIPEGGNINYMNEDLKPILENKLTSAQAKIILDKYDNAFDIGLTKTGFPKAAERDTNDDATNYDAVWVRDAIWVYYYFSEFKENDAKTLINKLYEYYNSLAQQKRFEEIIANPKLAADKMAVPHIRFDSSSDCYDDVMVNGEPQVWNHKQIDAHGLFLLALNDAYQKQIFNVSDSELLLFLERFFGFLASIKYYEYADAGAWEEIDRVNTSSISLVANAAKQWKSTLDNKNLKLSVDLQQLSNLGINKVKTQIASGGESPLYKSDDICYRESDAAMLHIFTPYFSDGLEFTEYQKSLALVEDLVRDYGVIRYKGDSYQSGNFWFEDDSTAKESLTDDASSVEEFAKRAKGRFEDSEAQWFFDSMLALAMMNLYDKYSQKFDKDKYFNKVARHLKRALAQMTASDYITADGQSVNVELLPESINVIIFDEQRYYLPSPITPLNWAKASLATALKKFSNYNIV